VLLASCGRRDFDPVPDGAGTCVMQISAGFAHTCVLHGNGTVSCWGSNSHGELGNGALVDQPTPVTVLESPGGAPFAGVQQITAGVESSTCALREGHAWCWGWNMNGQLGDGTMTDRSTPVEVMAGIAPLTGIAEIEMGEQHACARMLDSTVWCWGLNDRGQLGDGTTTRSLQPVHVHANASAIYSGAMGLMVSYQHDCVWDSAAKLECWGANERGEIGNNSVSDVPYPVAVTLPSLTSVSSANTATCASVTGGFAYCWGVNDYGELGDGTMTERHVPTPVLVGPGSGQLMNVADIGVQDFAACARQTDGTVWCWGDNRDGNLGIGSTNMSMIAMPVHVQLPGPARLLAAGNAHACAVLAGDVIACWGYNVSGQLGDGTFTNRPAPVTAQLACP
jgi:alpha-tubulin suppressor-like RCC1 family protein